MAKTRKQAEKTALRRKAEELLSSRPKPSTRKSKTEQDALIHQLEVHQIELEMQNDELRKTQQALEDSYRKITDLYDYAPVGYLSIDRNGLITKVNLTVTELLGYQRRFLTGKPFTTLIHRDDQDAFHLHMRSLRAGSAKPCEIRLYKKGRVSFDAQLLSVPFAEGDGNGGIIHIAVLDISERKQAESALRESEERYHSLFENANDSIFIIDSDSGKINDLNPSAANQLGYAPNELLGTEYREFHLPADFERIIRLIRKTRLHENVTDEHLHRRKDGDIRIIEMNGTVVELNGRKVFQNICRDVTDRRNMERALQLYANELSITNKELESFSYSIAHDLRAPLRAMKGFSNFILEDYSDTMDGELRSYLDRIIKSAETMDELIIDMLNLSKISRQEINLQEVDMSAMAGAIFDDLRHAEPERKVEVIIAEGIKGYGDERLLRIALSNLLGNAWKYSGKTPDARIEFGIREKDGGVTYYVQDNGAGFDMSQAENLFTPFKRLHSSSQFPGTGIGLAIVNRVIQRHQGRIWAESETGKGATFYFTLLVGNKDQEGVPREAVYNTDY